jgi:hypothetical protein
MSASVVMEQEPTATAMTAPVVTEKNGTTKTMMFMLPMEYNDMSKISKPTNPVLHIKEIPLEVGAVYWCNGSFDAKVNCKRAQELGAQLMSDEEQGGAGDDRGVRPQKLSVLLLGIQSPIHDCS